MIIQQYFQQYCWIMSNNASNIVHNIAESAILPIILPALLPAILPAILSLLLLIQQYYWQYCWFSNIAGNTASNNFQQYWSRSYLSGCGGKKMFKRSEQIKKKYHKKPFFYRGNFTPFMSKIFKAKTTSFHYFSPRILYLKSLDIELQEVGGKNTIKQSEKVWPTDRQTNKHTYGHFDL